MLQNNSLTSLLVKVVWNFGKPLNHHTLRNLHPTKKYLNILFSISFKTKTNTNKTKTKQTAKTKTKTKTKQNKKLKLPLGPKI